MHLDPTTHLALHRLDTERVLADPRRGLQRRPRPPGRLRRRTAEGLRRLADALATDPAAETGPALAAAPHR